MSNQRITMREDSLSQNQTCIQQEQLKAVEADLHWQAAMQISAVAMGGKFMALVKVTVLPLCAWALENQKQF